MSRSLWLLKAGESGIISYVNGISSQRLLDLGFTPGTAVLVHKRAPLGEPLEVRIRGYSLLLRRQEAEQILLK